MWRYNFLHRTSFQVDMAQSRTISDADNNQSKYLYLYSSRWHSSHQNGISNVWESNYIYICIISIYIWLQLYLYLILYLYFQICMCICIHQNLILGVESTWQTAGWCYLEPYHIHWTSSWPRVYFDYHHFFIKSKFEEITTVAIIPSNTKKLNCRGKRQSRFASKDI